MQQDPPPQLKPRSTTFHILVAGAVWVVIKSFALLSPILLSLLLILLTSLAVNPVISRLREWTGGRKGATALVAVALGAMIGMTGWASFGPMKSSVTELAEKAPAYWERLQKPLIKIEQQAGRSEEKLQAEVAIEITEESTASGEPAVLKVAAPATKPDPAIPEPESKPIRSGLSNLLQAIAGSFTEVAFNAAQMVVVLLTVFFGVTFTLMNPRPIFGAIFSLIPQNHHDKTLVIMQRIGKFVPGWAGATLISMMTIGLLVFLLMWPILGFTDALALGLIAGVLEAVPFLGPILSAIPAVLLALSKGGMTPLWVLLAYVLVQALEGNVIMPMVMARGMKLHPLAVIFSMLLCVATFGVLGVLVAAPLVAIGGILHDELYRKHFLPSTTDSDLDRLSRRALYENLPEDR
jgi:predicted PurR-regulated permease PerM